MARKNGVLTQVNDLWLKAAPKEAKREVGQRVNELKTLVEEAVANAEDVQDSWLPSAVREGCLRRHRHHPPRHSPPSRRGASRDQDA